MKSIAGKLNGFDYDLEAALQSGDVRGRELSSGAMHAGTGYTFANAPWKPRISIEYNYATGDSSPGDDHTDTFQNLFPTNHKFYGYMDLVSWQNLSNPVVQLKLTPGRTVSLQADYRLYWLAEAEDGWYRANGVTKVRPPAPGKTPDTYPGSEIDLSATWKPAKNLAFLAVYSHFFSGDYAKASGPSDDADFVYTSMTISFQKPAPNAEPGMSFRRCPVRQLTRTLGDAAASHPHRMDKMKPPPARAEGGFAPFNLEGDRQGNAAYQFVILRVLQRFQREDAPDVGSEVHVLSHLDWHRESEVDDVQPVEHRHKPAVGV